MASIFDAFFPSDREGVSVESKTIKFTEKDNDYFRQVESGLGIKLTEEQKNKLLEKKRNGEEKRREEENKAASEIEWTDIQEGGKRKKRRSKRRSRKKSKSRKIRVNKKRLHKTKSK